MLQECVVLTIAVCVPRTQPTLLLLSSHGSSLSAGVPAAAASGVIAANAMLPIGKHLELLDALDAGVTGGAAGMAAVATRAR